MVRDGFDGFERVCDQFKNWRWRIANLYWITDKVGRRVKFEPNWAQARLMEEMHHMNVVLKARQLGFTTFIQLFMLDQVVFNENVRAGTIAHNLIDAVAIFNDKVKYPYQQLPEGIRQARPQIRYSVTELALSNNSSIRVGTSLRSGTLNFLHISEYGKICAKYPEKAREVRTGALNTVHVGQWIAIESTAEGQDGDFYSVCETAQTMQRMGVRLTPMDFKFHFFAWWQAPEYSLSEEDAAGVVITEEFRAYFEDLGLKNGISLTRGQKTWYVKKAAIQLDDMKREYPSTPAEAFSASVEGAYYGLLVAKAESAGRVGVFKAIPVVPVNRIWDIGRSDATAIWFVQFLHGEIRCVGYYENSGEGMPHYAAKCKELHEEHDWQFTDSIDWVPHDARVVEWGSNKSRLEQLVDAGHHPRIPTAMGIHDGINAARSIIPVCTFDTENCAGGIAALKNYRKTWNEDRAMWSNDPFHNWASHGADAFRYLACAYREMKAPRIDPEKQARAENIRAQQQRVKEAKKAKARNRRAA